MVDEAARRAPQWIQDNFNSHTEQQHALPQQQQAKANDETSELK